MEKIKLHMIKGDYEIKTNGAYIVLTGAKIIILKSDGTLITSINKWGKIRKSVFINTDCMLLDCSAKGIYVLISLRDGCEKTLIPQPKNDYTCSHFTLSPDKHFVYDRYDLKGKPYYLQIDLTTGSICNYPINNLLRCVSDLECDQQGNPCFLQYHFEEDEDAPNVIISKNGIVESQVTKGSQRSACKPLFFWEFQHPRVSKFFLGGTNAILTQDLYVYAPNSGHMSDLIENRSVWNQTGQKPIDYRMDYTKQYLILQCNTVNIIIDLKVRKLVGRYAAQYRFGCIIGNEFWICTDQGVLRKPFPLIEDVPPPQSPLWSPWN